SSLPFARDALKTFASRLRDIGQVRSFALTPCLGRVGGRPVEGIVHDLPHSSEPPTGPVGTPMAAIEGLPTRRSRDAQFHLSIDHRFSFPVFTAAYGWGLDKCCPTKSYLGGKSGRLAAL